MALSTDQLTIMRAFIADQGATPVFSDDLLNSLYTFNSNQFFLTVAYVFRILQGNSALFNDYTIGQTSESKNQVYKNLEALAQHYEDWNAKQHQVHITGMRAVPPRRKARPMIQGQSSYQSSTVGQPFGRDSIDNVDLQSGGSFLK